MTAGDSYTVPVTVTNNSGGGQPDRQRSTLTLDGQGHWKVADSEVSGKCAS